MMKRVIVLVIVTLVLGVLVVLVLVVVLFIRSIITIEYHGSNNHAIAARGEDQE